MTQDLAKYIKTAEQINIMRQGGVILANILNELNSMIKPGTYVMDLEKAFIEMCGKNNVKPACKGYSPYYLSPFPTGLCVSINSQCVHCYPKEAKTVNDGDVITVDTVIEYKGLMVDSAFGKSVGNVNERGVSLVETSKKALYDAIIQAIPSNRIGDISSTIYAVAKNKGFDVLRDYAGHGIGRTMHEFPEIPCYGKANTGQELHPGLTICIEALVCEGKPTVINKDDWETELKDGKRFVQFEHTVLITEGDPEILTMVEK